MDTSTQPDSENNLDDKKKQEWNQPALNFVDLQSTAGGTGSFSDALEPYTP